MAWFDVDKSGLAAVLERRGKFFALAELIANAWDSGTDRVSVRLSPIAGQPYATLEVEDWGEGFSDLKHANTMFARSTRGGDPLKRGRFNLGEKLVLAVCRKAFISTTIGAISFHEDGNRSRMLASGQREVGTMFNGEIRMTRDEYAECCELMERLIPPVPTTFNGKLIAEPELVARFDAKLPTEIADDDGQLRRTVRTATVEVYAGSGELLELGVPVVETDNGYRVNVLQKVPLNMDRDNVTPAFLKAVQAALLNHVHQKLSPEEAAAPWAQEALGDARTTPEAVRAIVTKRFGERAVVATPNDPMANAAAEAAGFTVVPGGALGADAWANVRKHEVLLPASKVFQSPKPEALANRAKCPTCGQSV